MEFVINGNGVTACVDGISHTITNTSPDYLKVISAIAEGKWDVATNWFNPLEKKLAQYGITIDEDDELIYKHVVFPKEFAVAFYAAEKHSSTPVFLATMVNFMEKMLANPSHQVFQQLSKFIDQYGYEIKSNGNFIAYKLVRPDYTSLRDGVTRNNTGSFVSMPRDKCDPDPTITATTGLHFGTFKEIKALVNGVNCKIMKLEVNPAKVTCVPLTGSCARACEYHVVGEVDFDGNTIYENAIYAGKPVQATQKELTPEDYYALGYANGRRGVDNKYGHPMYRTGYRDGKGHRARKY